jgi:hypothetical protein
MMFVYLTTGECVELTLADSAEKDDEWLTCIDADGRTVAAFAVGAVETFTTKQTTTADDKQRSSAPAPA